KMKSILNVGLPTAIQMVIVNVSFLIVTGMLNNFGTSVVAATGIGLKINTLAGMPCWAIGQAVTTMVGQNMGAKDIQRVKDTTRSEEHTSELQSRFDLVCRLLLEKKN